MFTLQFKRVQVKKDGLEHMAPPTDYYSPYFIVVDKPVDNSFINVVAFIRRSKTLLI